MEKIRDNLYEPPILPAPHAVWQQRQWLSYGLFCAAVIAIGWLACVLAGLSVRELILLGHGIALGVAGQLIWGRPRQS